MSKRFPHHRQKHIRECGPVCLQMIAQYYGKYFTADHLGALSNLRKKGVNLLDISNAAEAIGMHTVGAKLNYQQLVDDIPLPGIAHWKGDHFVVVVEAGNEHVTIADPDMDGVVDISVEEFLQGWTGDNQRAENEGVILLMEPTADFFTAETQKVERRSWQHVLQTVLTHKKLLWFLGISILALSILTVIFPLFLQMTVDESIENQNKDLLEIIVAAWVILLIGQIGMDFVKRFSLFHIGSKVNIQLMTDFMVKLVQLPAKYFRTKMTDDVIQTFYDNPRVQRFLTRESVSAIYAGLLLLLFSLLLIAFDWRVFAIFGIFSILQAIVIYRFLHKRTPLNYRRHELSADHYNKLTDLIQGIKEIKLNNAGTARRWVWERSEANLYRVGRDYARSNELYLQIPHYLGEIRNIIIIYVAATAVISNEMTIGVLVAIIFILTQLNNPLKQFIDFGMGLMDTRGSLERMNEIHNLDAGDVTSKMSVVPDEGDLNGNNVSFRYEGSHSQWVLHNLDFRIPRGKITAIIGPSGSGKSTLLNLLLNFLEPVEGTIKIGDVKLSEIDDAVWLEKCGVVMQDGHLFNDTIAKNIALGDELIDSKRLLEAARIANILPFMERFPDGFSTRIGSGGVGLSKGQRQGILIARAVYKDPEYLFLDEATNDLDSENERIVLHNIKQAFQGRTVVINASRMNMPLRMDHVIPLAIPRSAPGSTAYSNVNGGNSLRHQVEYTEVIKLEDGEWKTETED